jgi:hypothetical protein
VKEAGIVNMNINQKIAASVNELQAYVLKNGSLPIGTQKIRDLRRLWHDDKSENFLLEV